MIEGNHTSGSIIFPGVAGTVFPKCIPPLPDSRSSDFHLVEPGWTGIRKQHLKCLFLISIVCQRKQNVRRSRKSGCNVISVLFHQTRQIGRRLLFILFREHLIIQWQHIRRLKLFLHRTVCFHQKFSVCLRGLPTKFPIILCILFLPQNIRNLCQNPAGICHTCGSGPFSSSHPLPHADTRCTPVSIMVQKLPDPAVFSRRKQLCPELTCLDIFFHHRIHLL